MPLPDEPLRRLDKARRFEAAAQALVNAGHFESSIGRAYYASFHAVVAFLIWEKVPGQRNDRWSHGYVSEEFRRNSPSKDAARRLRRLYMERLLADYTLRPISRAQATTALQDVRALIEVAEAQQEA